MRCCQDTGQPASSHMQLLRDPPSKRVRGSRWRLTALEAGALGGVGGWHTACLASQVLRTRLTQPEGAEGALGPARQGPLPRGLLAQRASTPHCPQPALSCGHGAASCREPRYMSSPRASWGWQLRAPQTCSPGLHAGAASTCPDLTRQLWALPSTADAPGQCAHRQPWPPLRRSAGVRLARSCSAPGWGKPWPSAPLPRTCTGERVASPARLCWGSPHACPALAPWGRRAAASRWPAASWRSVEACWRAVRIPCCVQQQQQQPRWRTPTRRVQRIASQPPACLQAGT